MHTRVDYCGSAASDKAAVWKARLVPRPFLGRVRVELARRCSLDALGRRGPPYVAWSWAMRARLSRFLRTTFQFLSSKL